MKTRETGRQLPEHNAAEHPQHLNEAAKRLPKRTSDALVNAQGGKWTDGGAAQQQRQDTKAVIRPRRSGSYVQIDAQGEELPFAAYEMKRSDALHCADRRTHL